MGEHPVNARDRAGPTLPVLLAWTSQWVGAGRRVPGLCRRGRHIHRRLRAQACLCSDSRLEVGNNEEDWPLDGQGLEAQEPRSYRAALGVQQGGKASLSLCCPPAHHLQFGHPTGPVS